MVFHTMLLMLFVAFCGLFKLRMRYDRLLSWGISFAFAALFYQYWQLQWHGAEGFSFLWRPSQMGNITIDFRPSEAANKQIIPIFFVSLLTVFNNSIFHYEERKSPFNTFVIFNLISLSLLITAENYVQLITTVFVTDIMGYLILKNVDVSHRYVIYNFFADMCLFMILALVSGRIQSLELNRLLGYEQIGRHKDFVSIVTTLALFIKMGCFLFQSYLLDVSETRFQRMSVVHLLTSPLVGLLLIFKLLNLLTVSDLFIPIFEGMAFLSFVSGIIGFIIHNHIQKKMVYLNMAFLGLLLWILALNKFTWSTLFALYYVAVYIINQLFFKIYLYQNRENDVNKMTSSQETPLLIILLQMMIWAGVFFILIYLIYQRISAVFILIGGVLLLLVIAIILNHIYKSPKVHRLDYLNTNTARAFSFITNSLLLILAIYYWKDNVYMIIATSGIFLAVAASSIGKPFRYFYNNADFQRQDFSKSFFFYLLVAPLSYLSSHLWAVVDYFLSEKVIASSFSALDKGSLRLFLIVNRRGRYAGIIYVIISILIFLGIFYGRIKNG